MGGSVFSEHVPLTGGKSGKMIKKWISGYTNSILESKEEHRMEFTPVLTEAAGRRWNFMRRRSERSSRSF